MIRLPAAVGRLDPQRAAADLHRWCAERGIDTMASVFERVGWGVVTDRPLAQRPTPLDAILVPMLSGGFRVLINPSPMGPRPSLDWLLAHEYAHALHYRPGAPPTRIRPRAESEEDFCDRFADAFTGSTGRARHKAA